MTIKEWIYKKEDKTKKSLIDRILSTRGIKTEEDIKEFYDISVVKVGEFCPVCKKPLKITRGIEVGNIFQLGTKYSEPMNAVYTDENGELKPYIMGCYGIGVSRTLSAIVEQNCDDHGMVWPEIVAPYKLEIVIANIKDDEQVKLATEMYNQLLGKDDDVLLDDRKESFGVKLNDAELIGVPYIVVVGRGAANGVVEIIKRNTLEKIEVNAQEFVANYLKQ